MAGVKKKKVKARSSAVWKFERRLQLLLLEQTVVGTRALEVTVHS